MAIKQDDMIALLRAAKAFRDAWRGMQVRLVEAGVDPGVVSAVAQLTTPDIIHSENYIKLETYYRINAGRNFRKAQALRVRRGALEEYIPGPKELKRRGMDGPTIEQQLKEQARWEKAAEAERAPAQLSGLPVDNPAHTAPATELDLPLPEGMGTASQDEDLEIDRDSPEYQEFLRQTGGPLDPSKLKV